MKAPTYVELVDYADKIYGACSDEVRTQWCRYLAERMRPFADEYQGWPNRATWAVHHNLTNDGDNEARNYVGLYTRCCSLATWARDVAGAGHDTWSPEEHARFTLADALKELVLDITDFNNESPGGMLLRGLIDATLEDVDWNSLADAFLEGE
jgi:hypothetical protein